MQSILKENAVKHFLVNKTWGPVKDKGVMLSVSRCNRMSLNSLYERWKEKYFTWSKPKQSLTKQKHRQAAFYWARLNILHYLFKLTEEDELLWCEVILQWVSCREAAENMKALLTNSVCTQGQKAERHPVCRNGSFQQRFLDMLH